MKAKFWGWVLIFRRESTPEIEKENVYASGCWICKNIKRVTEFDDYPVIKCDGCSRTACRVHNGSDDYGNWCMACSPYSHKPVWDGFTDNDPQPGDGTWWCTLCSYMYCGSSPAVLKNSNRTAYRGKEPGGKIHNVEG